MLVEIRMYKQYDLDLLALFDVGYPVSSLFSTVLINYAHGIPVKFLVDEVAPFEVGNKHTVRTRINISDEQTIKMLKGIKRRYRNSFCKMLMRNALTQQNLNCYFADPALYSITAANLSSIKKNVKEVPLSALRNKRKIIRYMGMEVTPQEIVINNDVSDVRELQKEKPVPAFIKEKEQKKEKKHKVPKKEEITEEIKTEETLGLQEPAVQESAFPPEIEETDNSPVVEDNNTIENDDEMFDIFNKL